MEIKDIHLRALHMNPSKYADKEVIVRGWVRQNRNSNKFGFLAINDGSFFKPVQVVYEANEIDNFEEISKANLSAGVMVKGILTLTPNAKQPFEIHAVEIRIEAGSDSDYPLQNKRHSMEFLREIAHLRPRANTFQAVFRVRSLVAYAIHKFFQDRGFVYVHTPIITGSDAEGAGEMFQVTTLDLARTGKDGEVPYERDFFGKKTSLTVSGQLEGELGATALGAIYTFGPTFRAENSNTPRHLAEFWMIEPEVAFLDKEELMDLEEDFIKYCVQWALDNCKDDLEFLNKMIDKTLLQTLESVVKESFVRLTYTEGIHILEEAVKQGHKFEFPITGWGMDLSSEHERFLVEEYFKRPVIMTDYPSEIKAFYMKKNPDGKTMQGTDVLFPRIGEIIGGSVREESYDKLVNEIKARGMEKDCYSWYLDTRKYGSCPHAGFGLGFERLILFVTGMQNIRDVIPFPRTPKSAEF